MSSTPRILGIGIALGLAAGLLVGVGLTAPARTAAISPSAAPIMPSGGTTAGAPGALPAVTGGGTTVTSSGSAIAYPFFGGAPGIAPDHTIVVTGVGQADMATDGSDRAASQKSALVAALADAKAQADAIAAATGLRISGVLSVSASVSPSYGVLPMMGGASGSGPGQPLSPTVQVPPYPQTLSVSVTVEYRVS
ncbi:MAG: SIMPL domain-containing protein [Chloroflexi bacterium]|nr:SIMPL domain-containing protein [Chloroflexota bacterium]